MFKIHVQFCIIFYASSLVDSDKSENVMLYEHEYVPRVVNGWPGKYGDVPYQIAFKMRIPRSRVFATFCGGTIIGPTKLLSAAHCFADDPNFCQKIFGNSGTKRSLSQKYAVAGNLRNRDYYHAVDSDKDGQWRSLSHVNFPKTYKFPKNDIAVVFVRNPFNYNRNVNYISYTTRSLDYHGECLASGFGRMGNNRQAEILYLANLKLLPMALCNRLFRRNMRKFICTSTRITDVGKGDSGGPLVCKGTNDPKELPDRGILVGVVSGNRPGSCSFFTRVSSFKNYIERSKCCSVFPCKEIFIFIFIIKTIFALF